ncbi:hypothetical protein [Nocardioides sp.]|uniref:hypothetical protein n=1 Tax=Nocardioides sp. TaxID=35761 RepID=UPI002EDB0765
MANMDKDGQLETSSAEEIVEDGLRAVALAFVDREPTSKRRLAESLHMNEVSVEKMLSSPRWELGLAIKVVDKLGVGFRVVGS